MAARKGGMRKGQWKCTKKVTKRIKGHTRKVCVKFARKSAASKKKK